MPVVITLVMHLPLGHAAPPNTKPLTQRNLAKL